VLEPEIPMRKTVTLFAALAFAAGLAGSAGAAPCKDAKGRFVKCPATAASAPRCRDKTTKAFAKCGAPNTEPVPMAAKKK
jgi:hypothetical protein